MTDIICPGNPDHDSSYLLVQLDGRQIRRCDACSLVFAHPMPELDEIAEYYQGFVYGMPPADEARSHAMLIHENVERIVEDLRAVGCKFDSALDFGGSLGYYADALADHFQTVDLFDVDRDALGHARRLFPDRFGVQTTDPGEMPKFDRRYDLVFANQVIEHYTDLDLFFATLRSAAHDDTVFVITTPNNASWSHWVRPEILLHYTRMGAHGVWGRVRNAGRLARDSWLCCDPPRHVLAFDRTNLPAIAERQGLQCARVSTVYCIDDYYSPPKYRPVRITGPRSLLIMGLNLMVRLAIRTGRRLDRLQARGENLVLLARPSGGVGGLR